MRKRVCSLMLLLVLLSVIPMTASAHDVPDFDRLGTISFAMKYNGSPVPGGSLTLFRVADVVSDNGDMIFDYTADFDSCSIPVTELDSAALPSELAEIAEDVKLTGTTQNLNAQGKTKFEKLQIGLYLVVQKEPAPGYTAIKPFLVSLPQMEKGRYVYDVDTAPKNIPEPEIAPTETTAPTEPPKTDDKLPQTGQTNWPVPVMAAAGMLLLAAGICLRYTEKRKQDEA